MDKSVAFDIRFPGTYKFRSPLYSNCLLKEPPARIERATYSYEGVALSS
jgi:hypothetical protein